MRKLFTFAAALAGVLVLAGITLHLVHSNSEIKPTSRPNEDEHMVPEEMHKILVTGFEPFGGNSENASWEGVRALSGRVLKLEKGGEVSIAIRQLKVEWGQPLIQLRSAIEEVKPIAVYSFGQGNPGAFRIETLARNSRAGRSDNRGVVPIEGEPIIDLGSATYRLSPKVMKSADKLIKAGWPVGISSDAGRYLCEECLYSLLYLQDVEYPGLPVMFVHVPQLETMISNGERVSPDCISDFICALIAIGN
jgi:pyroglutamyl-peptidase